MTVQRLSAAALTAAVALGSACLDAKPKAADTSVAATPDSAGTVQPATATPAPPSSTVPDSSTKGAAPKPSSSPTASAPNAQPTPSPTPTPSETVLTGRVSVGGLAGQTMATLQIEGGTPVRLVGPLEAEMQRLNSARVWVTGAPVASPANGFSVTRYDIVAIDGAMPVVGVTLKRAGAVWLATAADTIKLVVAPADLTSKVGAKVWITGRRSGAEMTVQSFGIIREP